MKAQRTTVAGVDGVDTRLRSSPRKSDSIPRLRPQPPEPITQTEDVEKTSEEFAAELEEAQERYRETRRPVRDARADMRDAIRRFEQWRESVEEARKKESQSKPRDERARRVVHEARRNVRDARQQGRPTQPHEAAARRYEAEARRTTQDLRRWTNEATRKERELDYMKQDVKARKAVFEQRDKAAGAWRLRVQLLERQRDKALAEEEAAKDQQITPLTITEPATLALKDILDGMEHGPSQALRLVAQADGNISLALDTAGENDQTLNIEGRTLLLIETPLPETLRGATLDVAQAPEGTSIVLSPPLPTNGPPAC